MRNREEIKNRSGMQIKTEGEDGFAGTFYTNKVISKNGKVKLENPLNFIFSNGCGFEHLSVSTPTRCPTWDEMCIMKEVFWNDDEVCMQLHPKKEEYVNNHPFCLHIWKPIKQEIPIPPSIMVGIRTGHEEEDIKMIKELASQMAHW